MGNIRSEVSDYHLKENPNENGLIRRFLDDFDVTWARRVTKRGTNLSAYYLRPLSHTVDTFGFDREVLLIYSAYSTLEERTFMVADDVLHEASGRLERLTYFLVSPMPNAIDRVRSTTAAIASGFRIIVCFEETALRTGRIDVRHEIRRQALSRDLFDDRDPLESDTYFFGRDKLLMEYVDAARRASSKGIFGLRKTGKTSFLLKLKRDLNDRGEATVLYFDCSEYEIRALRWYSLLGKISGAIAKYIGVSVTIPTTEEPIEFVRVFTNLLSSLRDRDRPIGLIFDEVEYITALSPSHKHWREDEDFFEFWQALRTQLHQNIFLLIAGVNPSCIESSQVRAMPNPLFGIVSWEYLTGLDQDATSTMLKTLGRRMGIKFDSGAVSYIHRRYGGHPLLTRLACSDIHKLYPDRPVDLKQNELAKQESRRDAVMAFYCQHVVSALSDFYADEYELLEWLAVGKVDDYCEFTESRRNVTDEPPLDHHLRSYGLVDEDSAGRPRVAIPVIERYVAWRAAHRAGRKTIMEVVGVAERVEWVKRRILSIIDDIRRLERLSAGSKGTRLYGNSIPNTHWMTRRGVVGSEDDFTNFIVDFDRCLVEGIDGNDFNKIVQGSFPDFHDALNRIHVYRTNRVHIRLYENAVESLEGFLRKDLEGRRPENVDDLWFVLQQCVLDGLHASLQIEISRLDS